MNGVIAGVTWGAVDTDGTWRVVHEHPSVKRPQPGLSNYLWHLEATLPGKPHKAERDVRASAFTAVGSPGECMRGHFENLMTALMLPPHMRGTTAARAVGLDRTVFVIPAFFELLLHLKARRQSFSLVFRTFGHELAPVVTEFNAFCEGRHPLYPSARFDGSDGQADMRASLSPSRPDRFFSFFRSDDEAALVMGTLEQPECPSEGVAWYEKSGVPRERIIRDAGGSFESIHAFLHQRTGAAEAGTLAVRDYYPYWRDRGEVAAAGKLLMVDSRLSTARHDIFFDDNIRYTDAKIVDVRHPAQPHDRHSIQRLLRTHLVRCEPLHALHDPQYFVRHVERLHAMAGRRLRTLHRLRWMGVRVQSDEDGEELEAAADPLSASLSRSRST